MSSSLTSALALIAGDGVDDESYISDFIFTEPSPSLYAAMSYPGSSLAMVHREVPFSAPVQFDLTSTSTASYTFSSDVDFHGTTYVVIKAPILVNQCTVGVDVDGVAGGVVKRVVLPASSERPGCNSAAMSGNIVPENGSGLVITFGVDGTGFDSGGGILDQNNNDDISAYYGDYCGAHMVQAAELVIDDIIVVSNITNSFIVAVNELYRTNSCKHHDTLGHFRWSTSSMGTVNSYDEAMRNELKVRCMRQQTWLVELPLFTDLQNINHAFPTGLLTTVQETRDGTLSTTVHSLKLTVTFSPLNEAIVNGSNNVSSTCTVTCATGESAVDTVTFVKNADTSNSSNLAANIASVGAFNTSHFQASLIVTEIVVDADSMSDFLDGGPYKAIFPQATELSTQTAASASDVEVNLSSLTKPLSALIWFPRLQMDTYRNMWYRMRGMPDQVSGRFNRAIVQNTLTIGSFKYADSEGALLDKVMPSKFAARVPRDIEMYMYSFCTKNAMNGGPGSEKHLVPGSVNMAAFASASLNCTPNKNIFADNTATGGLNMASSTTFGGPSALAVTVLAVEQNVLTIDGSSVSMALA
jgi:hypothetical protein